MSTASGLYSWGVVPAGDKVTVLDGGGGHQVGTVLNLEHSVVVVVVVVAVGATDKVGSCLEILEYLLELALNRMDTKREM